MFVRRLLVAAAVFAAFPARADLGFPDSVKFPAQVRINPDQSLIKEDMAEVEFAVDASGSKMEAKRGAHYARWFAYVPAAGEPALGYDNGSEQRIYKALTTSLAAAGWKVVWAAENRGAFSLRRGDSWLAVKMDAPQAQVNLELIEPAAASKFALKAPGATPEKFGDNEDLPWLSPPLGARRTGGGRGSNDPLDVTPPGAEGEPRLVGQGVYRRSYLAPSLSALQFSTDYRAALTAAGWTVVYPPPTAADSGQVIAHYDRNGRDVWVRLFYEYGGNVSVSAADVGSEDWAAKLAKDCRLPLYGVFFDFNKATIKPESDAVLQKVAKVLGARLAFAVEVQGHTDNVGGDDYNMKLSNDRAAAVKAWLGSHGVDASKVSSKGYGKTQPVADNGTDVGRAKNRRVELRRDGCR